MKAPTQKGKDPSSPQEVTMRDGEALDRVLKLRRRFQNGPLEDMDSKMSWPEAVSPERELEEDKRAYAKRKARSGGLQALIARQGRSGVSPTSLADMLDAQALEQEAKDDTSK